MTDVRGLLGTFANVATDADMARLDKALAGAKPAEAKELVAAFKKMLRSRKGVAEATPSTTTFAKPKAAPAKDVAGPSKAVEEPVATGAVDDGEDFEHAQHHADDRGERDRRVQVDQADRRHARRRWWSRWRTKPAAARGGADRPNRGDALEMRAGREFSLLTRTLGAQEPLPDLVIISASTALDAALFVCAVAAVCTHTP